MKARCFVAGLWGTIRRHWYWVIVVALIILAIVYSYDRRSSQAYWDGAIGNWLATLLGILVGVPIALWIERWRISREERERIYEHNERAKTIAFLIQEELAYNQQRISERIRDKSKLPLAPLKMNLWKAMSDSGEIRWIENPSMLDGIASAYYFIGIVTSLEDKLYQVLRGINVQYADGTYAAQHILSDARKFDADVQKSVVAAIAVLKDFCSDT